MHVRFPERDTSAWDLYSGPAQFEINIQARRMANNTDPAGCGAPPRVFFMPALLSVGVRDIAGEALCDLCWADDSWTLAKSPEEL